MIEKRLNLRILKKQMIDLSYEFIVQRNFSESWLEVTRRPTYDAAMDVIVSLRKTIAVSEEVVYVE